MLCAIEKDIIRCAKDYERARILVGSRTFFERIDLIILGIDPGSRKAGYALIELVGKKVSYIDSGVLSFDHIKLFIDRIEAFYSSIKELVDNYHVDEVALESLIYVKSPTALIKLAQARGAMLAALQATHKGKIFEYSPNEVKSVAAGHGHAKKENVQKVLGMILGEREYKTNDESDALAVALCHAMRSRIPIEKSKIPRKSSRSRGLGSSVKHAIKNL